MNKSQMRNTIIDKARKKYIPSKTMNISEAFELWLKDNPSETISLTITKETKPKNEADLIGRPNCSKCSHEMMLRIINEPQGKANLKGWKTCWECLYCGYEEYSVKTIQEWIKESSRQKPEKPMVLS